MKDDTRAKVYRALAACFPDEANALMRDIERTGTLYRYVGRLVASCGCALRVDSDERRAVVCCKHGEYYQIECLPVCFGCGVDMPRATEAYTCAECSAKIEAGGK